MLRKRAALDLGFALKTEPIEFNGEKVPVHRATRIDPEAFLALSDREKALKLKGKTR